MNIKGFIECKKEQLVTWRRQFHQYPEVGWTEYVTTHRIYQTLTSLGFKDIHVGKEALSSDIRMGVPPAHVLKEEEERALSEGVPSSFIERMEGGHTGLVATLDSGKKGPHIALRFDIDALPISESESHEHYPSRTGFASTRTGQMHACAHDGHTTIGLGVASFLAKHIEELQGRYTLLFQPAEEGSRGAKSMVQKGWLDDVDFFLSGHIGVHFDYSVGDVSATSGGFLATTKCDVSFKGVSAHAGKEPEKGKNALLAAATASIHLHGISRHGDGKTRVNVGTLHAGSGRNIIPEKAEIQLETRGATVELNQYMISEAERIIQASAALHDVEATIEIVGDGVDATSDEWFIPLIEQVAEKSHLIKNVIPKDVIGVSEDAAYMINRVQERGGKATYLVFGTPLASGHHHSEFDYQEDVLSVGVEIFVRAISELQGKEV